MISMNKLERSQNGIVGLILLGLVVLVFIIFVGKRVWDANQDTSSNKQSDNKTSQIDN